MLLLRQLLGPSFNILETSALLLSNQHEFSFVKVEGTLVLALQKFVRQDEKVIC
jgi:hypothetical protein